MKITIQTHLLCSLFENMRHNNNNIIYYAYYTIRKK